MRLSGRAWAIPTFLLLCLVLGGSSQGIWRNLLLQLLGLGIIAWAAWTRSVRQHSPGEKALWWIAGFAVALPPLQLLPLPPSIWSALPGRIVAVDNYSLLDLSLPWLPISLVPYGTSAALLGLIIPLAVLAGMLRLDAYHGFWCGGAILLGAFLNIVLGALQISNGGPYLFVIHNAGAVGAFANRNALGSLLVASIPFALILAAQVARKSRGKQEHISMIAGLLSGLALLVLSIVLNGSLAALSLALLVATASIFLMAPTSVRQRKIGIVALSLLGIVATAAILFFGSATGDNAMSYAVRQDIYARTVRAVGDFWPWGSGLGSFLQIYPMYEDPAVVTRWYVNHAHSDYLELILETGVIGALLLLTFAGWWLRQAWRVWTSQQPDQLALAGTVASAALLLHSAVDYPLRTAAMSSVFAACLALMVQPRSRHQLARSMPAQPSRHLAIEPGASA